LANIWVGVPGLASRKSQIHRDGTHDTYPLLKIALFVFLRTAMLS
jgi:hypothetical protein